MPTAGRLAAAIAFAVFGWYFALFIAQFFPEGNAPSYVEPLSVTSGLLCGWMVCGSRAGRGYYAATGNGLTAATAMAFWILFLISFVRMIRNSMRNLYDGPLEAVVDVFGQMIKTGTELGQMPVIITLIIGGVVGGWFAEYFAARYP